MKLIIVRHGELEGNVSNLIQGGMLVQKYFKLQK